MLKAGLGLGVIVIYLIFMAAFIDSSLREISDNAHGWPVTTLGVIGVSFLVYLIAFVPLVLLKHSNSDWSTRRLMAGAWIYASLMVAGTILLNGRHDIPIWAAGPFILSATAAGFGAFKFVRPRGSEKTESGSANST